MWTSLARFDVIAYPALYVKPRPVPDQGLRYDGIAHRKFILIPYHFAVMNLFTSLPFLN